MPIKKIFFSYSRQDASDFAQKLATDLGQQGYDAWIDLEGIRAGREWDVEIEKALNDCDCLLFFESEHAVTSKNVLDEVYYALEQGKKVIPIIVKDSKTPYRLQRLQHIDLSQDYTKGLNQLLMELKATGNNPVIKSSNKKPGSILTTKNIFLLLFVFIVAATAVFFLSKQNTVKDIVIQTRKDSVAEKINADKIRGRWNLVEVLPKERSYSGLLIIETSPEGRITLSGSLQFYYIKNNDTIFLNVFNSYPECKSCVPTKEMRVEANSEIGWTALKIRSSNSSKEKKRDTIMNAGYNQKIKSNSSLEFVDDSTFLIKIKSVDVIRLDSNLSVPKFEYIFRLNKEM